MTQEDPAERIRRGRNRAKNRTRKDEKEEVSGTPNTSNTDKTEKTSKTNLKEERKAVQIYIEEKLKRRVEQKRLELQGALGREIEKNRELWPLIIERGLNNLSESDFKSE